MIRTEETPLRDLAPGDVIVSPSTIRPRWAILSIEEDDVDDTYRYLTVQEPAGAIYRRAFHGGVYLREVRS